MEAGAVFGGVAAPPRRLLVTELRALATWRPPSPDPRSLPRGDGGPVLVLPAFLTADAFTAPLRRFLDACGHRSHGWRLGVNWGPTPALLAGLASRLRRLSDEAGGAPVALVGVSLGGLLARHLAHAAGPLLVRHVATLGSPLRLPTASPLAPIVRPLLPRYARDVDLARLAAPPPVPATVIWTRDDGIIAPCSCVTDDDAGDRFEVGGAHMVIARNPAALAILARRLAA